MGIAERHRFERSTLESFNVATVLKRHREKGMGEPHSARLDGTLAEVTGNYGPRFIVSLRDRFHGVWTIGRAVYEMTSFHGHLLHGNRYVQGSACFDA
jgi:hypothetical protein